MSQQRRRAQNQRQRLNESLPTSPILARVISHLDSKVMGGLEVTLLRNQGNTLGEDTETYSCWPAFPFFGYTGYEFQGLNNQDFNDTQKSYGMWMVPPDVGVTVMVVFIEGDPSKGYWIACVPPDFNNHMVPALGASTEVDLSKEDQQKYNTTQPLPVGNPNKKYMRDIGFPAENIDFLKKPVHPIADRFLEQGTLEDDIRGPTTTTARRDIPSAVYGISTPGPLDRRPGSKRARIGKNNNQTPAPVPVSRLGGTTFVMDDGDDRYQRKTPASEGPVDYADTLNDETGDPTIPYNEYFRIRTRTGHQILMHNSEDLIYIGNAKGTTWIELTANGKIDIYAEDSISVHTQTDINFRADRDVNIEAGRNINMKATAEYQSPDSLINEKKIQDAREFENGRIQFESAFNTNILVGANLKVETRKYKNIDDEDVDGNLDINIKGNTKIATGTGDVEDLYRLDINTDGNVFVTTTNNVDLYTEANVKIKTGGNLDLNTDGNNAYTAGGSTDILSGGNHTETAARIDMNGPTARTAEEAVESNIAEVITDLILHDNVRTDGTQVWADTKYQTEIIKSIMRRVPMHEPWAQHEHLAPQIQTPNDTDRELGEE